VLKKELKEQKSDRSFRRSFENSKEKTNHSFVLLQRAMQRAIAYLLFFKERLGKRSHIRSFENERLAIM